eukprot:g16185.t1
MPDEDFIYLGDNARLPYGTKSPATVVRYAQQASAALVNRGVKALVVACNTASGLALDKLQQQFAPLPVIGVVLPGAAAAAATDAARVVVLATESTVAGGAYQRALLNLVPTRPVLARSCPLWVTLAEMGPQPGELVETVLKQGLRGLPRASNTTFLLGCTHFPVFSEALQTLLAPHRLVDSAQTTASRVAQALTQQNLRNNKGGEVSFLATDGGRRFARVGSYFLGAPVTQLEVIDL